MPSFSAPWTSRVPASVVQRLLDSHLGSDALITLPAHDGHRGHPVIFDATLRAELSAIREETQGIRAVLQRHEAEIKSMEIEDPAVLLDLNAPADVASARDEATFGS